ncbi:MAG: NIPSNAP family protein [Acidimicrobiia bacterium]|nr:NIPSNAP family protein [Acidimicrobiia bacterium]
MIYELRIYRFHPGQKATFLAGFKKATRFMKKYGITFVAAFENPAREDEFVWIRSFPSRQAREQAIDRYYHSPEWLKIVNTLRPTIRRREVRILARLPYSPLR